MSNPAFITTVFLFIAAAQGPAQSLDVARALRDRYLDPVKKLLLVGEYERAADLARQVIADGDASPDYHRVMIAALRSVGAKEAALSAAAAALKKYPKDLPMLMLRYETLRYFGQRGEMDAALKAINAVVASVPAAQRTAADWLALGKAALAAGADPKLVTTSYYNVAKKKDAKLVESYLALGELALEKGDFQRAAKEYNEGLKQCGEHADLRTGLARAFAPSDRQASLAHIQKALALNPRCTGALLQRAEHLLGAENFKDADVSLSEALKIDSGYPAAWALRSVIAHLGNNDQVGAGLHRLNAMKRCPQDPEIDHAIGKALSRAYRFAEGAGYQRQALKLDGEYLRAKLQLANDLMRLGQTAEAWKLAAEVRAADAYNTQAHNLGLLEKEMEGFHEQRESDFVLRMPKRDWQVYGPRALEILRAAKAILPAKYGLPQDGTKPTMVEFFPSQQDFAIRTFGSLGGQGLLGVCFGTVITMNSPGSLAAGRNNWESTLWHEYCHVVTLGVTKNKMPRWLSEGISVYEEANKDPAWGMAMDAAYRKRILDDEEPLTPMSELSSAFMSPKDGEALMFAYFLSARAVEYLIAQHGTAGFQALLAELATGTRINAALERHIGPLKKLDEGFKQSLVAAAKAYAPEADFGALPTELAASDSVAALRAYLKDHPASLPARRRLIGAQLEAEDWKAAAESARRLTELEPEARGAESGAWLEAKALHKLGQRDDELRLLREVAEKSSDAAAVFSRLMELEEKAKAWPELEKHAVRAYALNPFLSGPTEALALAAEGQGKIAEAAQHYERLLLLEPANPAMVRYKLASLYAGTNPSLAKRHLLDALVEAPRYKLALELLKTLP